jgi:non-ribosomal peptide synthetase component F
MSSARLEDQEAYWLERFSGELPVLNMPTDYERPAIQRFEGDHIDFCLDEDLTRKVNRLIRETGTTLYMVLLAVYTILLSKYSGQTDIIIGTPIAGRNHIDLEDIMGLFLETLVIRNYPQESKTFEEFLEEVKENTLTAFENQSYPFSELIKQVGKENERSRNPVFDTMLIVQNIEPAKVELEDLTVAPVGTDSRVSKVDITLEAAESKTSIDFDLEYCTKLFKREAMERLVTFFKEILSIVVDNMKIKLKDIKMSHAVNAAESDAFRDDGTDFGF